ncbi:aromatic ring-hydroxylating oxygenase subunit alpha [Neobacillus terrae]|uniref:aromatic ring-hydroxylating oxygenase subunit alpha n=1 Tax=Neobacillus terrae TaxID=3034837 RepID=UPI00140A8A2D|nr:SRPBCC family protein [Neobacillus terrae]NHM30686.1 Rieske 2Fe-2S domain-containing protein [Neobacillus terrae]
MTNDKNFIFSTIPYSLYVDPDILAAENELIFERTWQIIGHENDIKNPGDFITCDVAGEPIVVVRGEDNLIRAFYNVCPHRATRLENNEAGNKKILQCSYHGWTFHLDGKLHRAPNFKDNPCFCSSDISLKTVRCEVEGSLVFVNLDPNAPSLYETYKDFFDDFSQFNFHGELRQFNERIREIKCNWKAFVDNYLECDHCPIAHPGFAATLDLSKYQIINQSNCSVQGTQIKEKQNKQSLKLDLDTAEVQEGRFYWLWPNTMITVYPGPGNISIIKMSPIDHETTKGTYQVYFKGGEPTPEQQTLLEFAEQVRIEDLELVEREQIGFRSKAFSQGILSPSEHGVLYFHNLIRESLNLEKEALPVKS